MPAARKWQPVLELGRVASFLSKKYYGVGTKVEALMPSKYLDLQVLVILPLLNVVFCLRLSAAVCSGAGGHGTTRVAQSSSGNVTRRETLNTLC